MFRRNLPPCHPHAMSFTIIPYWSRTCSPLKFNVETLEEPQWTSSHHSPLGTNVLQLSLDSPRQSPHLITSLRRKIELDQVTFSHAHEKWGNQIYLSKKIKKWYLCCSHLRVPGPHLDPVPPPGYDRNSSSPLTFLCPLMGCKTLHFTLPLENQQSVAFGYFF